MYETAVALQEFDCANVIAAKLLSVRDSDATYAALITAARRCKGTQQAKALYHQARERLGSRRVGKSKKALGCLASSLD